MKTHLISSIAIASLALPVMVGCEATTQAARPTELSGTQEISAPPRTGGPLFRPGPSGRSRHDLRRHGSLGTVAPAPVSLLEAEPGSAEIVAPTPEPPASEIPPTRDEGEVEFWPGNP